MADESTALETIETEPSIDIEAASDKIGADLFPESLESNVTTPEAAVPGALTDPKNTVAAPKAVLPSSTVRQAPKSWAKDVHPVWEKIDPKGQEYIEKREKDFLDGLEQYKGAAQYAAEMHKVLAPYQPLLQAKNVSAPAAIDDMLGAYTRLTQGTVEQRQAALSQIAKNLQIPMPTNGNGAEPPLPIDPRLQTIEQRLQEMQDAQTRQQQLALQAAKEKASVEVNAFASDPAHAFFDDCHEDIVKFLQQGDSLPDAYEKAVWANPVTREKSKLAYFQTESEKAAERKRLDALPKQKARGVNVNGKDTQRPPTDPLGSMDDTLRSTFNALKEKTVH